MDQRMLEKRAEFCNMLNDTSLNELFEKFRQPEVLQDVVLLIKKLFNVCSSNEDNDIKRRYDIFKLVVNLMDFSELPTNLHSELVDVLIPVIDSFPTSYVMRIATFLVVELKKWQNGDIKWLLLFPKLLSTLSSRDSIIYKGIDNSGADLKTKVIKSLFSNEMRGLSMQLASALSLVSFNTEELDEVTTKLLTVLQNIDHQEIPTFIYHLLPFCYKGKPQKVLEGLINYFTKEDAKLFPQVSDSESSSTDTAKTTLFLQVEGTAILLVRDHCRQNAASGKEFLALLRSVQHLPEVAFSPFVFSVALALVGIQCQEKVALDILKNTALQAFKLKYKTKQSFWVRNIGMTDSYVFELVKNSISKSLQGWDHVSQGLVKFGFLILDSFGPKQVCGRVSISSKPHLPTISEEICALGSSILRSTFRAHKSVRSAIFEQILTRVIDNSTGSVTHYINVLAQTVGGDPVLLLEVLSKVIELLDFLPQLPYPNALGVLKALTPLLKISMPLKDSLMLILRKGLFHRDVEPRKIAISGYLTILKRVHSVGKLALSQSQMSICSSYMSGSSSQIPDGALDGNIHVKSRAMCLEIMSLLRRVLMQQAELKQLLYESLYDVVVANPILSDIVLELLLTQFEKLLNVMEDSKPPLNLSLCIAQNDEKTVIEEPIAHLMTSIILILQEVKEKAANDLDGFDLNHSPRTMLEDMFDKLLDRMTKTDLEDFGFNKNQDVQDANSKTRHKELAFLLMAIYESLMEYALVQSNQIFTQECCQNLQLLHNKYKKISDCLQGKKPNKATKGKVNLVQLPNTHLTILLLSTIVENLFHTTFSGPDDGLNLLRADNDFVLYVLQVTNNALKLWNDVGKSDNFLQHIDKSLEYIGRIATVFLRLYSDGLSSDFAAFDPTELSLFFVEGLGYICSYMFSSKESYRQNFACELAKQIPAANDDALSRVLKKFQRLTIKVLSDTADSKNLKEVVTLLSIISCICSCSLRAANNNMCNWVKQLCQEQTFEEASVAKKLLSLGLLLNHQHENCFEFIKNVSFDIHYHLGDIEEETVPGTPMYSIINARTAHGVLPVVITHLEQILNEVEWFLLRMKTSATTMASSVTGAAVDSLDRTRQEESVSTLLSSLVKVVRELVCSNIPNTTTHNIVKLCIHLYKCFSILCKYYLTMFDKANIQLHSSFGKMVKLSGTQLTTAVYAFINYLEEREKEAAQTKKMKIASGKDSKTIPSLVFEIEFYERHLIALSKKSKVNLMAHMKLSTARDFRINAAALDAVAKQREEQEEQETTENMEIDNTEPMDENSMDSAPSSIPGQNSKKRKRSEKKDKEH